MPPTYQSPLDKARTHATTASNAADTGQSEAAAATAWALIAIASVLHDIASALDRANR